MTLEDNLRSIRADIETAHQPIKEAEQAKQSRQQARQSKKDSKLRDHLQAVEYQRKKYDGVLEEIRCIEREANKLGFFKGLGFLMRLSSQKRLARREYPLGYKSRKAEDKYDNQRLHAKIEREYKERKDAEKDGYESRQAEIERFYKDQEWRDKCNSSGT